jgi:hypothetical protein
VQVRFHFVDAGINAGLVDLGRVGEANSANYIIAALDRMTWAAWSCSRRTGSVSNAVDELLRSYAEGALQPDIARPRDPGVRHIVAATPWWTRAPTTPVRGQSERQRSWRLRRVAVESELSAA